MLSRIFCALLLAPLPLAAQVCPDVMVENHFGAGMIAIPGFVAGEEGAAVFEALPAEYPIEVLRVGIAWGSLFGGSPQSLEGAIRVYEGAPPAVTQIFSLPGPVLSDGVINEFDLEPLPGDIIIASGPFTVSLLLDNNSPPLGPSMVIDGAGCIPGHSFVNAIPGGWTDLCAFGASGNWVIHVVYRSVNCGPGGVEFRRGDANSDTHFDIADAIRVLSALFGPGAGIGCEDAGDVNDDGSLDIADAIAALGAIFGTTPVPAPGPSTCGPDPTADSIDCLVPPACP